MIWIEISVSGVGIAGFGLQFLFQGSGFQDLGVNGCFTGQEFRIWVASWMSGVGASGFGLHLLFCGSGLQDLGCNFDYIWLPMFLFMLQERK